MNLSAAVLALVLAPFAAGACGAPLPISKIFLKPAGDPPKPAILAATVLPLALAPCAAGACLVRGTVVDAGNGAPLPISKVFLKPAGDPPKPAILGAAVLTLALAPFAAGACFVRGTVVDAGAGAPLPISKVFLKPAGDPPKPAILELAGKATAQVELPIVTADEVRVALERLPR